MCNGTPFTIEKITPRVRIELGPLDQQASASPTELPGLLVNVELQLLLFWMSLFIVWIKTMPLQRKTQKEITSQTDDKYLVILSSKTYVFEDKITKY